MSSGLPLERFPLHLAAGGAAVVQPAFDGADWYEGYGARHPEADGRLVSLFRFDAPWTSWEMHPAGDEMVYCVEGRMTLHQEHADGARDTVDLDPGEFAINPPGTWHTADAHGPVTALFITVGAGTTHRPRE